MYSVDQCSTTTNETFISSSNGDKYLLVEYDINFTRVVGNSKNRQRVGGEWRPMEVLSVGS